MFSYVSIVLFYSYKYDKFNAKHLNKIKNRTDFYELDINETIIVYLNVYHNSCTQ